MTGADWSGRTFRNIDLSNVKMVDAQLSGADLSGAIDGMVVNGIEIAPLIAAEMDRRYPERRELFVRDPAGLQAAWART